jgi:hypothetical protein
MRINAVNYGAYAHRYGWSTPEAARSLEIMVDRLNPTHVVLPIIAYQETIVSTDVDYLSSKTVGEEEVIDVIERLHAAGLKVILKPMVDVLDGTWRAYINFFDFEVPTEPTWAQWFESYTAYQLHFAHLAASACVEMFVVGCEMCMAQRREAEWRALITDVRRIYPGLITYNADKFQEDRIEWWDSCDVITSSGYYPLDSWATEILRIEKVVKRFDKPFLFLEAGCRNAEGAVHRPGKHDDPGGRSDDDQRLYYEAMFEACESKGFVDGYAVWDWPAQLSFAPEIGYCPYERPAEAIIRSNYDRTDPRSPKEARRPLPPPRYRSFQQQPSPRIVKPLLSRVRARLVKLLANLGKG